MDKSSGGASKAMQMLAKMQAIKTLHKQLEQAQINATSCSVYARKLSEHGITSLVDLNDPSRETGAILDSLNLPPSDSFLINEALSSLRTGGTSFAKSEQSVSTSKKTADVDKSKQEIAIKNPSANVDTIETSESISTGGTVLKSRGVMPKPLMTSPILDISSDNNYKGKPVSSLSDAKSPEAVTSGVKLTPSAAIVLAKARAAVAKQNMSKKISENPQKSEEEGKSNLNVTSLQKKEQMKTNNSVSSSTGIKVPSETILASDIKKKTESKVVSDSDSDGSDGSSDGSSRSSEESGDSDGNSDEDGSEEEDDDDDDSTDNHGNSKPHKTSTTNESLSLPPTPSTLSGMMRSMAVKRTDSSNSISKPPVSSQSSAPSLTQKQGLMSSSSTGGGSSSLMPVTTSQKDTPSSPGRILNRINTATAQNQSSSLTRPNPLPIPEPRSTVNIPVAPASKQIVKTTNGTGAGSVSTTGAGTGAGSVSTTGAGTSAVTTGSGATMVKKMQITKNRALTKNLSSGSESSDDEEDVIMSKQASSRREEQTGGQAMDSSSSGNNASKTVKKTGAGTNNTATKYGKTSSTAPTTTTSSSSVVGRHSGNDDMNVSVGSRRSLASNSTLSAITPPPIPRNVPRYDSDDESYDGSRTTSAPIPRAHSGILKPTSVVAGRDDGDVSVADDESVDFKPTSKLPASSPSRNKLLRGGPATQPLEQAGTMSKLDHNLVPAEEEEDDDEDDDEETEENAPANKRRTVSTAFFNNFPIPIKTYRTTQPDIYHVNRKKISFNIKQLEPDEVADVNRAVQNLQRAIDSRDPVSARQASAKIADLCLNDPSKQTALGELGACAMITSLLWGWLKEPAALEAALCACASLCKDRDGASSNNVKNISALRQAGALDMVVGTIQRNITNVHICEMGCLALTNLAYDDEERSGLGTAGGCEVVMAVLGEHLSNPKVVCRATDAMEALTREKGNVLTLNRLDACKTMVAVLNFPDIHIASMSAAACSTLGNLGNNRECVDKFLEAQSEMALVENLSKWIDSAEVVEACCMAISKVASHEQCRKGMVRYGVCEAVVQAFRGLMPSETVSIAVGVCISELVHNSKSIANKFDSFGLSEILGEAISFHDVPAVDESICWAIYRMCVDNQELTSQFGTIGLCQQVAVVLERGARAGNEVTVAAALAVVSILALGNTPNQTSFALTSVSRVLMTLLEDEWAETIHIRALWAISILCRSGSSEDSVNEVNVAHFMMANIHTELLTLLAAVVESTVKSKSISIDFIEALCWATRNISMLYGHALSRKGCQLVLEILSLYRSEPRIVVPVCSTLRWLANCKEIVTTGDGTAICVAITQVMEDYFDDPAICEAACGATVQLSVYDEIVEVFVSLGVCAHLVNILNHHITNSKMSLVVCATIHDIGTSCSLACQRLFQHKACEALISAMKSHPQSVELCDSVCCSIYVLGMNPSPDLVNAFNDADAGVFVVNAMKEHMSTKALVIHACRAVWVLCTYTIESREAIGGHDGCQVIIEAMKRYYDNMELAGHGCRAIYSLCKDVPENVDRFSSLDAYAAVMTVLQRAFTSQDVFLVGITARAVMSLCYGSPRNQERFGGVGACELISGCLFSSWMRGMWNIEGLILAVAYLCRSDASRASTNVRNLNLLIAGGAIKMVVRELRRHKENLSFAKAGCIAIRNIAYDPTTKASLGSESACEVVYEVLTLHGKDSELTEYAAGAIANLAGTLENVTSFMDIGVYESITEKLLTFVNNEIVTIACCSAIVNLAAGSEENPSLKRQQQDQFGALEIHELLVVALDMHKNSPRLAVAACGSIMNLTEGNPESATVFGSAGACEAVARALSLHGEKSDAVAAAACSAIWCLAMGNAKNKRRFGGTDACEMVVTALVQHMSNPSSAEHACLAIRHLADGNGDNSGKLGGAGACEAVIKVLSLHVGDTSVAEAASGAVVSLSTNNRENAKRLGGFGASDEVVRSLQKAISSRDETLGSTSASAVSRLTAASPDNQQSLGTAGACELMIELLQSWKKKPRVEAAILNGIASLCRYGADRSTANALNISRMVKAGALEIILKKLKDFLPDSDVCDAGCLALRNLAHEEEHQSRLGVLGACDIVLAIFRKHMSLPDVTEKACGAISNLALIPYNAKSLAENDVFSFLGQAFFMHLGILDTAIAICGAVVNLTANGMKESASIMESSGIFKSIVKALNVHIESPYMGMAVCLAISNLIHICQGDSRDEFIALGACEAIVAVFQHNGDNPKVVCNACRATYHIAYENNTAKDRFGRLGACEMITRGLLAHYESEEICDNACLAIRNLSANHLENKSRFGGIGGCRAVIKALITHPASLSVAEAACLAVRNLSGGHPENVSKFGDADAVQVLRAVLQNHVSSETVVEQACASLANIVANNETLKTQLEQHNASEPIVLALQVHHSNAKILAHVCLLLANMAGDCAANATQLVERGACETLVLILKKNISSAILCENACSAIANIAFNKDSITRLTEGGACEALADALQQHVGTSPGVNEAVADAVSALAVGDNIETFGKLGVCAGLAEAVGIFNDELSVVVPCVMAITKLAVTESNLAHLHETEICDALTLMVKLHSGHDTALVVGFDAIYTLTKTDTTNQLIFGETGLSPLLMHAIANYPDFSEVLQSACKVIMNIAKNEQNRANLGRIGACPALVRVINNNRTDNKIATLACSAIARVAEGNMANKVAFNKEGAPSAIHAVIATFQGDVALLIAGVEAAWRLTEDYESALEAFTSYRFASIIVDNLKSFVKVSEFAEVACGAIAQFATHPVNNTEMRSLGVCDLIAEVLTSYLEEAYVVIAVCKAISKLSNYDKANAILLNEKNICKSIVQSFQKNLSSGFVIKEICSAISSLCQAEPAIAEQFDSVEISGLISSVIINHASDIDVLTELNLTIAQLSKIISVVYKSSANFECQVLVNVLNNNIRNRALAINGCRAIANLAATDSQLSDLLGAAGACDSVLTVTRAHDEDPHVLTVACLAIDKLCAKSSGNSVLINDANGPLKLTDILRKMTLVELVIPNLCGAIHSLTITNVTNRAGFGEQGACQLLLDSLRAHKTIDKCVIAICSALYALALDHENRSNLIDHGANDILMPIIELHSSRGLVMASLFLFLSSIVIPGSPESIQLGKDVSVCNSIVTAFRNHSQNPSLVADVSRVIHCLTNGQEETARMMGTAGVCELLTGAFREFQDIPDTVERICYAIGSMQCPQNITKLKSLGIIGTLVKALKAYIQHPAVVKAVAFAIRFLAGDEKVNESFAEFTTCEVLMEALSIHLDDNPETTEEICRATKQLTFNQTSNVNLLQAFRQKACPLALRALRRHQVNQDVAVSVLWLIRILATEIDARMELGDMNACEVIIQTLQQNYRAENVITQSFWTIRNLCSLDYEKNLQRFTQCDGCTVIGGAYKVSVGVAESAEQGAILLRILSDFDQKNVATFVKTGACETAIEALVGHMEKASVVENSLSAIKVLLREKNTLAKFITLGTLRSAIQAGRTHADIFEVCEQLCQVMTSMIVLDPPLAMKFGELDACELLNDILKDHNRIQSLITHGCTTISVLCLSCPQNAVTFGTTRILDSILVGFQRYLNSPAVCKAACDAIHRLCYENTQNAAKLGQIGVCDLVVSTLQKYRTQPEIVESALCSLWRLSEDNADNRERVGASNGCEEVVYALKDYIQLHGIALAACAAIWHLADAHIMNRKRFEALNASVEVQKVLKIHLEREDVTKQACGALWSMVVNASNDEGTSIDGCRAVVNALTLHLESAGLAEVGCIAMANMSSNLTSVATLGVVGACDTVIKTMVAHIRDVNVVEAACSALCTLALNTDNKNRLNNVGANKVILNAVQVHVDKQQTALALLQVIARTSDEHSQNAVKYINLGVCDLFTLLLKLHPASPVTIASIFETVVVLATFGPELLQMFGDSGLCEAVVSIMNTYIPTPDARIVCEQACKAACQMAYHLLNLKRLMDAGALLAVVQLIQGLPDVPNIVIACAALTKFMTNEDLLQKREHQKALADAGMCEGLVQTFGIQLDRPNVLKISCQALVSLCTENDANKMRVFKAGVYGGITTILDKHGSSDCSLAFAACSLLDLTCFTTEHQTAFGNAGACEAVAKSFSTSVESRDEQSSERIGRAIVALIVGHSENQIRMGLTSVSKIVVSMLWGWVKNVVAEEVALWISAFLCRSGKSANTTCLENVTSLRSAGIYDGVMGTMRRHTSNSKICQAGCWVIRNLACEMDHVVRLQGAGACETSATALLNHIHDANVVEAAAGAIANMAILDECVLRFLRLEVIQGLCRALQSNYGAPDVVTNIFAAIQNLAQSNMEVKTTFGSFDVIPSILHIGSANCSNVSVMTMFCGAVESLSSAHENNRAELGRKGACELIIQCLVQYIENDMLVTQACGAIRSLTELCLENSLRVGEVNGCETVVMALELHIKNEGIAIKACQAIRHLATGSEKNMKKLVAATAPDIVIRALREHEGSVIIAEAASWALRTIATSSSDSPKEFGERPACEAVLSALKTHIANSSATEQNLAAVVNLTIDKKNHVGNVNVFVEIGILDIITDILRRYVKIPEVCLQACWVVENVSASNVAHAKTLGEMTACETVVAILRRHIANMDVSERACMAMYQLGSDENNQNLLGSAGACEAIGNVLQTANQNQSPKVANAACKVICRLAANSSANQDAFGMAGCCRFVSATLAAWLADFDLLENILFAIALLCRHGKAADTVNEFNSAVFNEQRVDECIVRILQRTAHTARLAEAASVAVRSLAYDKDTRVRFGELGICSIFPIMLMQYGEANWRVAEATAAAIATLAVIPENKMMLSESGSCEAVLTVLASVLDREDTSGAQTVERCCWALQNLSLDNKNYSEKLGREGVCEVLVLTLRKFIEHDSSVVLSACGAIWNISNGSPENKLKFCQCGLAPCLVKALQTFDGEIAHSVAIAGAIRSVTSHKETPESFVTNGASDALVKTLRKHIKNASVVEQVGGAIANIVAADDRAKDQLEASGVCETIVGCMRRHSDNVVISAISCRIIGNLAKSTETAARLGTIGACESVTNSLRRFASEVAACQQASYAIRNLAQEGENRSMLGLSGCCELLIATLRKFIDSRLVAEQICGAITNLCADHAENNTKFNLAGASELITNTLKTHVEVALVVEQACRAVSVLAININRRYNLGVLGVCEGIIGALERHLYDAKILVSIINSMCSVASGTIECQHTLGVNRCCDLLSKALGIHKLRPDVTEQICYSVYALSENNPANLKRFAEVSIFDGVVSALYDHQDIGWVCSAACRAIHALSLDDTNLWHICSLRASERICLILRAHINDAAVVVSACIGITALTRNESQHTNLRNNSACSLAIDAFNLHHNDVIVLRTVLETIAALAKDVTNAGVLGKSNLCALLTALLEEHKNTSELVSIITFTMHRLLNAPANCIHFGTAQTYNNLIENMQRHGNDPSVAINSCLVMQKLALSGEQKSLAGHAGGCEGLVNALLSHVMNTEIVKGVCKALVSVCEGNEGNVERAGSAGACDLLMSIIQRHSETPSVVAAVFETIKILSSATQNKEKFGNMFSGVSGCDIISTALAKHGDDTEVVQHGCEAIVAMCKEHPSNALSFGINETYLTVLQAMQKHITNEFTSGAASAALWSLAYGNSNNNARIAEAGAIAVLVEALRRHGTNAIVCGGACGALSVILDANEVYLGTLRAVDARRAVIGVLGIHFEDVFAGQSCLHLLRVMYEKSKEDNLLPAEGECQVIVKTLNAHLNNIAVAEEACSVISALGSNLESPSSKIFGTAGACPAVCTALEHAITNRSLALAQAACSALVGLVRGSKENQEELGAVGACRQVVIILSMWQDATLLEKLEDAAMAAIVYLSRHSKDKASTSMVNIERFRAVGACEAVSLMLEKRMERPSLVELCCRAMANLANDPGSCARLVAAGACELATRALRIHQENIGVAEYACGAIANLATSEASRNVLAMSGACEAIVGILFRRTDILTMATQACVAIQNLASNDMENKNRLGGAGACKSVTMVLQCHHEDAIATQAALGAMVNLISNHNINADRLVTAGACDSMVRTWERFYQNEAICRSIFLLVRILSVSADKRRILRDVNTCQAATQALRHYITNDNLTGMGCGAIASLVEDDPENMALLGQLGMCQLAVEALISHAGNHKVAENACNLVLALSTRSMDNRTKLIASGAPDAIIKILDKNIESPIVAIQSCKVVKFLASDPMTRAKLSVAGACPRVAEMLRRHISDSSVAGLACGAVYALADSSIENREKLAEVGVCELVATALQTHCDDAVTARDACLSIVSLAEGNASNLTRLSSRQVCLALSAVLQRHRGDPDLAEGAARAVKSLAALPESRTFLGRNGICQPLADALVLHVKFSHVIKSIAWAAFWLATDEKLNSETLGSVGACEGVVKALQAHIDDTPVVEACISTIWTLAANVQTNKNRLGAAGACDVVTQVLSKYLTNREITKPTLVAMRNLASNNVENKAALGMAGACGVVVRALSSQSTDTVHVEQACGVMANLANSNANNASFLNQAGAAEVLSDVLKNFVGHTAIMKQACLIVCHMASANVPQLRFRELGICDSIVKVLSAHVSSNVVNAAACAAIRAMAFDVESKSSLGDSGVCAAVCKALTVGLEIQDSVVVEEAVHTITVLTRGCAPHQEIFGNYGVCELLLRILRNGYTYEVNEKVIWAIAYLCRHDSNVKSTNIKNVMKFTEAGLGQMILPLLQQHGGQEEFVLAGCITIRNICSLECNVLQIGQLQGCEIITNIIKRYHQFDNICEAVCGAIANLAKGDCRLMFYRAGVCQLLVQLLVRYSEKASVMEQICGCISNLSTDCQENKQVFGECEACEAVVRILRKHQQVSAVALRACMTIRNLASNHPSNKTRLGAAGACEAVVGTLKIYATNPAIVEVCDAAIRALATGNAENSNRIVSAGGATINQEQPEAVRSTTGIVWKAAQENTE